MISKLQAKRSPQTQQGGRLLRPPCVCLFGIAAGYFLVAFFAVFFAGFFAAAFFVAICLFSLAFDIDAATISLQLTKI